ncbi:hypothetical protein SDC9_108537 [bioreactor metagenome]|uniref:Uncharacterized protein n=1 Tax=bioreactor metagenome TaxID=1076179 RepID=A0A645B8E7_9ZZZZ
MLANYTVYDFETSEQKPRSYSFRQISYKDSLQYVITSKYYFVNKISVRYYEQGKLFWNSFSELPQQSNIEISAFPMLNCKINENIQIGLGGRVFFLEYGNISNNGNAQNRNQIYSYSPEASFNIKINKLTLICYGWMEYKYQQNEFVGSIPNIFLQTSYNF